MLIRTATLHDLVAITAIYNDFVLHSTAIWNEQLYSVADRQAWFSQKQAQQEPIIVAIDASKHTLIGYASYGAWRHFDGFRHTVEHSLYVDKTAQGRGVGSALLRELIKLAQQQNKHAMVACIESGNQASISLHDKFAFRHIGTFPQVGQKFGQWLDLCCMQRML